MGILKIDVEGHELAVLEGTRLEDVGDVFFEEHQPLPSPVSRLLEAAGFVIHGIEESLTRPLLVERTPRGWDAPTYLASRDPAARAARDAPARLAVPTGTRAPVRMSSTRTRPRRKRVLLIALGVLVVLVISGLLARFLTVENARTRTTRWRCAGAGQRAT